VLVRMIIPAKARDPAYPICDGGKDGRGRPAVE
jgi:hypothetical protein